MRLQICKSCWSKDTQIKNKMETIQLLLSAKNDVLVWKIMKENTNFAC